MKSYEDAGLASLAKVAGYRGETLTSLLQASNFCRTHVLLQAFEAFYCYFLSIYYLHMSARRPSEQRVSFEEDINACMTLPCHKLVFSHSLLGSEGQEMVELMQQIQPFVK